MGERVGGNSECVGENQATNLHLAWQHNTRCAEACGLPSDRPLAHRDTSPAQNATLTSKQGQGTWVQNIHMHMRSSSRTCAWRCPDCAARSRHSQNCHGPAHETSRPPSSGITHLHIGATQLAQPNLGGTGEHCVAEVIEAEARGHVERKPAHHQWQESIERPAWQQCGRGGGEERGLRDEVAARGAAHQRTRTRPPACRRPPDRRSAAQKAPHLDSLAPSASGSTGGLIMLVEIHCATTSAAGSAQ